MRRSASESDLAWVVQAKAHDSAYPMRALFSDDASYWGAIMSWQTKRREMERTAPQQRVTAAEVAAYEESQRR